MSLILASDATITKNPRFESGIVKNLEKHEHLIDEAEKRSVLVLPKDIDNLTKQKLWFMCRCSAVLIPLVRYTMYK